MRPPATGRPHRSPRSRRSRSWRHNDATETADSVRTFRNLHGDLSPERAVGADFIFTRPQVGRVETAVLAGESRDGLRAFPIDTLNLDWNVGDRYPEVVDEMPYGENLRF